jgi:hypothetical protein
MAKSKDTRIVRSTDHKSHYVIGAIPQWTDNDLRLHLYNEVVEGPGGPYYISTSQIILPKHVLPKIMDSLRLAMKKEGKTIKTEASGLPPEISKALERDLVEKKQPKKKVQKIRRK